MTGSPYRPTQPEALQRQPLYQQAPALPGNPKRRLGLWIGIGAGAIIFALVAGLVLTLALPHFLRTERVRVISTSMAPTLKEGTTVSVTKVTKGKYVAHRGDIVAFNIPPEPGGARGIRLLRVIAGPGEVVRFDGHHVLVNGQILDEPYAKDGDGEQIQFAVRVPAGRIWLMGDNRTRAVDSRGIYLGTHNPVKSTIAIRDVIGIVKT
ncbi:MAG TPA: signal peptidase I [Actinocatenispora sp.]